MPVSERELLLLPCFAVVLCVGLRGGRWGEGTGLFRCLIFCAAHCASFPVLDPPATCSSYGR